MYYKIRNQAQNMPVLSSLAISKIVIFKYLVNTNLGREILTCAQISPDRYIKKRKTYYKYILATQFKVHNT